MIRLGASSMFFHEYMSEEIFAAGRTAGLEYFEFWMETPEFWMRGADVDELLARKAQYPDLFPLAMHAPIFDLNPCSFNPAVAQLSLSYTCKAIDMLETLGGGVLTIHPGKRTAKRPPGHLDHARLTTYLDRVGNAAFGTHVTVAIENMPPSVNAHMLTPSSVREMLDEYSWLSFTWDYAHAQEAVPGDPGAFARECGERMVNIHASCGVRGSMHMPLAQTPAGENLMRILSDIRYAGLVTFELEDMNFHRPLDYAEKTAVLAAETAWFSGLRSF